MKLKKYYTLLKLFIVLALVLLAAGCGGTDGSVGSGNAETGAITAKLNWSDDTSAITNSLSGDPSRHILSAPAGVVTVRIIVSGTGMSDVQKDFAAADGQGTVDNIPAGSGRTVTAQGLGASGNVIAKGAISNITIVAGQTTDAGTITMQPLTTPPSTPSGFAVTAVSSSQINLSWNASTGATGYKIYKDGSYVKSVTTTSTSDTGLSPATNYCYSVTAYNAAGESTQTSQVCATTLSQPLSPPSTPTGFAVTAASSSQINLSWNASTGATGYKIYKDGSYLKSVTATSTSDTGLSPSTNYCYYVTAYNSVGESTPTSQQCAMTLSPPVLPPSTPTGFAVNAASSSQINLSWNASTGAIGYTIYRDGSYPKSVTTTSTSDTGLSPSTNYCYYVTAYNSAGESTPTSQQCAMTLSPPVLPPSTPTGFAVNAVSSSQINLSWNASTGATGYKIYNGGAYLKSVTTTSTSDTGLSPATNYCYTVSAYNSAGESTQTPQACAVTLGPPVTTTGTWLLSGRCEGQSSDAYNFLISLNETSGGSFTGSGSGTDYTGTPLQVFLSGNYNSASKFLSATQKMTFTGQTCAREDSFSTTLTSNDTGYITMTKTYDCGGCFAQTRMIKQ